MLQAGRRHGAGDDRTGGPEEVQQAYDRAAKRTRMVRPELRGGGTRCTATLEEEPAPYAWSTCSHSVKSCVQACRRQSHRPTARSAASSGPSPAPRRAPNALRVLKAPTVRPPSRPQTSATTISPDTRLALARLGGNRRRRAQPCRPVLRQVGPPLHFRIFVAVGGRKLRSPSRRYLRGRGQPVLGRAVQKTRTCHLRRVQRPRASGTQTAQTAENRMGSRRCVQGGG